MSMRVPGARSIMCDQIPGSMRHFMRREVATRMGSSSFDLTRTGDRLVAVADDLDGVSIERFSCLGGLDAPTPTLEQDDAESLLEKVDLLDERGRRYVECPRCPC